MAARDQNPRYHRRPDGSVVAQDTRFWWVSYYEGCFWKASARYDFRECIADSIAYPRQLYPHKLDLPSHHQEIDLYPEFKNPQR